MQWVARLRRPSPFSVAMVVAWLALQTVAPLGHAWLHAVEQLRAAAVGEAQPVLTAAGTPHGTCVLCALAQSPGRPAPSGLTPQPLGAAGAPPVRGLCCAVGVDAEHTARGPPRS